MTNGVTWSVHFRKTVMETQLVSEGGVNICPTDISLLLTASLSMSSGSCISLLATTEPSRQKYLVHTLLYRPCLSPQEWPTMWNVFFFFFVTLYKTPSPAPPTTFTLTASTLLRDPCRCAAAPHLDGGFRSIPEAPRTLNHSIHIPPGRSAWHAPYILTYTQKKNYNSLKVTTCSALYLKRRRNKNIYIYIKR